MAAPPQKKQDSINFSTDFIFLPSSNSLSALFSVCPAGNNAGRGAALTG